MVASRSCYGGFNGGGVLGVGVLVNEQVRTKLGRPLVGVCGKACPGRMHAAGKVVAGAVPNPLSHCRSFRVLIERKKEVISKLSNKSCNGIKSLVQAELGIQYPGCGIGNVGEQHQSFRLPQSVQKSNYGSY
jgi:hypothetical protein